jgi:hypothetical protein
VVGGQCGQGQEHERRERTPHGGVASV